MLGNMNPMKDFWDVIDTHGSSCGHHLLHSVHMWPYFVTTHFILVAISMKARIGSSEYASSHPLASWFVLVTSCFGGTLLVNFMMSLPLIDIYSNGKAILLASLIWYLIFFSPYNFFYQLVTHPLIKCVLLVLKEVHRIHSIYGGVSIAASAYSGNLFIVVLLGTTKGSAAKFLLRPLDSFVRGNLSNDNEFLKPTFSTKYSMLAAFMLFLHQENVLVGNVELLLFALFVFAATVQVFIHFGKTRDPFLFLEEHVGNMCFSLPENDHKSKKE